MRHWLLPVLAYSIALLVPLAWRADAKDSPAELMVELAPPLDFEWASDAQREQALKDGSWIPMNPITTGLKAYKDKLFLSLPRWVPGNPVTLATLDGKKYNSQPKLTPWPSWAWQNASDCTGGLAFVMGVEIDPKGRIWVLDTGNTNLPPYNTDPALFGFHCPASVRVFDIETQKLLAHYQLPADVADPKSNFLNDICVDPVNEWAYISDNNANWAQGLGGVVAVNPFKNISTRLQGPSTSPEMRASSYLIGGVRYTSTNPINSISLHPTGGYVYYAPNTGYKVYQVATAVLKDTTLTPQQREAQSMLVGEKPSPTSTMMWASNGTMFFTGLTLDALLAWTWGGGLLDTTWWVAYQDHDRMQFIDQFDFDVRGYNTPDPSGSNLWILSNQLFVWLNERKNWVARIFKSSVGTSSYMDAIMDGQVYVTNYQRQPPAAAPAPGTRKLTSSARRL